MDTSADLRMVWLGSEVHVVIFVAELGDSGHIEFFEDLGAVLNVRVVRPM